MCEPISATQALVAISAGSAALQFQAAQQQQKYNQQAQERQNELARKNALQRYAAEQLKIKQIKKQTIDKGYEASLKAKKTKSEFITGAGERGVALSGSQNALLADYYRTEGNYKASLLNNLNINIDQFNQNMEAIQFGQEAQSTYVQPPNPELLFVTSALSVANTYYGLEADKELRGLKPKGYLNQIYPKDNSPF